MGLADLDAYAPALRSKPNPDAPEVTFRDLWDHPEERRGQQVRLVGRVARMFRQPAVGSFPPLVEAWLVNSAGDPFCVVFPAQGAEGVELGLRATFVGTFLRLVRYQGGDTSRVVPLIVGSEPPKAVDTGSDGATSGLSWSALDWMFGGLATIIVANLLLRRHLRAPVSAVDRRAELEPRPIFEDGEPVEEGEPQ